MDGDSLQPGGGAQKQVVDDLVTESYLLVVEKLPHAKRPIGLADHQLSAS